MLSEKNMALINFMIPRILEHGYENVHDLISWKIYESNKKSFDDFTPNEQLSAVQKNTLIMYAKSLRKHLEHNEGAFTVDDCDGLLKSLGYER